MSKAEIFYKDIGDYLSREEKLKLVNEGQSILNPALKMTKLKPNKHGDWINKRNSKFNQFIPIEPEKKFDGKSQSFFLIGTSGLATSRDAWCYNFSEEVVTSNIQKSLNFFNQQSKDFVEHKQNNPNLKLEDFINLDSTKISWDRQQKKDVENGKQYFFDRQSILQGLYRPFQKQWVYFNRQFNNCVYQLPLLFPNSNNNNIAIIVSGIGASKDFSALATDNLPNYHTLDTDVCFPLYWYEKKEKIQGSLFEESTDEYIRHDAVSDFILDQAKTRYGPKVSKEDIFYYVYGILHSPEYRKTFANDLKKMLPRLPLVEKSADFWAFVEAGKKLADIHLNYEEQEATKDILI